MPQIVVLPHEILCPEGAVFDAPTGTSVCDALLGQDIEIEHACEKSCACTTCHVVVREGFNSLNEAEDRIIAAIRAETVPICKSQAEAAMQFRF